MATASDRRTRRGPMEIERFGELVLSHIRATQSRKSRTPHCYAARVVVFLDRRLSGKTTAEITPDLIDEFAGTCGDLAENTRDDVLSKFRLICKYAVDWGYLGRNPFDDRPPLKSPARDRAVARGRKLDIEQVDRILKYTDSTMDDWGWDRLHAIAATFAYAGLMTGEALDLKLEDCDLEEGAIRVRRRAEKSRSKDDPVVDIPPRVVERLRAWLPRRLEGRRAKYLGACYGMRLAEDGVTEVPDEAQRAAVDEMIRLRGLGWGTGRIADELTRRGIATKTGNPRWHMATVQNILKREGKYDLDAPAAGGDGPGRAAREAKADPGWMFPSITGGHWSPSGDPGYSVTEQLKAVGQALGIEGLTSESLRRFYLENRRYILSLWGEKAPAGPTPATPGPATDGGTPAGQALSQATPASVPRPRPAWPPGRCPVSFGADGRPVAGQPKDLTGPQLKVIRALLEAGPKGLKGDDLLEKSGCGGYRNILRTLSRDEDWRARIRMAGNSHEPYRLAMPGDR